MRKSVTKIVKAILGFAMAIGAGVGAAMSSPKANPVVAGATSTYNKVSNLVAGDEILIVSYKGSKYYRLPQANGSSSAPTASEVTVTSNSITGDYDADLFKVVANSTNWKFQSVANDDNYLYTTNSNNGIRIGTNSNNIFTVTKQNDTYSYFQMKNTATNRYVGVYNTQDWRCYDSATASNYGSPSSANQVQFYKKDSTVPAVTVAPTSLVLRIGDSGQSVTATPANFSGTPSYSWTYRSGTDCVDLTNSSSATVTMTPKNSITGYSTGVYRVTATYSTESATADVSVIVDRGGVSSPYTIAQARAAIDRGTCLSDAFVKGVVYNVDSFNDTYKSITYWISDDGSTSNPLEVYGGLNVDGGDFSSIADIKTGDIVTVTGTLKKFISNNNTVYEFDKNNELVTKISVASIAVKTAPTKVSYNSSEYFEPNGLVVTATYNDTPNPTTMDFAYGDLGGAFTFNPTTSTGLTDQDHVTITLFGKAVDQAITVATREITAVALNGDMTKKSYYYGDSWDLSGLYLSLTWNTGLPAVTTVNLTSVDANDYDLDKAAPARGDTSLYIYGVYEGFDFEGTINGITVGTKPIQDVLRTAATSFNLTDTSYTDFSNKTNTLADINSGVTWAGKAACTSKTFTLQLNGTSRGIYTTASSGQFVKSVSVDFGNDNDKELYFYASNIAYTAVNATIATDENSTLVATLDGDTTSANISGNYKFLYIYSSGAIYMNSITVTWKLAKEQIESTVSTKSTLAYTNYTDNGNGTFGYENLGIRFGGKLDKDLWSRLNSESDIEGYGLLFTSFEYLNAQDDKELKNYYASADGTNVKKYTNANTVHEPAEKVTPTLVGNDYTWMLYYRISSSEFIKDFVAVAFIIIDHDVVFFDDVRASAGSLAYDLIDSGEYAAGDLGGSLKYLADLYEETL